jgi:hypothetical protein
MMKVVIMEPEEEAIGILNRRMGRVTAVAAGAGLIAAAPVGMAAYILARELQYWFSGSHLLYASATAAALAGIWVLIKVWRRLRTMILRALVPGWLTELAERHRIDRARLEQVVSLWG